MKRYFIAVLFVIVSLQVYSQVAFNFIPELQGRNIDGLFASRILNSGSVARVYVTIDVEAANGRKLFGVTTREFRLLQGNSSIPPTAVNKTNIQFANTSEAKFIKQNGYLPQGQYAYIFSLYSVQTNTLIIQQSFDYLLEPLTELLLTEPYNQDEICNNRPVLSWQPSVPAVSGTSYSLVLAEIKSNQNAVEALNYNFPIINQKGIFSPVFPYPSISKTLEQGKKYAWQVTAYKDQTILNRSEIWQFTINCEDPDEEIIKDEGYRDIEDLLKGNYYLAVGVVKFSLINSYDEQSLKYTIESVNAPGKQIRHLPKVKLKRGKNKIILDLTNNPGFKKGYYYLLKIQLPNGATKTLRFIYK